MYAAGGVALAFAVGLSFFMLSHHNVITYIESRKYDDPAATKVYWAQRRVVTFFQADYKGGLVLMESFGNENIAFELPSSQLVYEGSYRQWLPALHHPAASHIAWIITRCGRESHVGVTPTDRVCNTVTNAQLRNYKLVYQTPNNLGGSYYVYRLKQGATP
jgi:hypothetical protein